MQNVCAGITVCYEEGLNLWLMQRYQSILTIE